MGGPKPCDVWFANVIPLLPALLSHNGSSKFYNTCRLVVCKGAPLNYYSDTEIPTLSE